MKKILYLLLCLFTVTALLFGCGKDSGEGTTEERNLAIEAGDNDDEIDNNHNDDDKELDVQNPDNEEETTTEDVSSEETTTEDTASEETTTEASNEPAVHQGSGTFNGFADSHTIEVSLSDGNYQTYFVYEEDVYNELMKLAEAEEPPVISYSYTEREGQEIPEIIELH